MAGEARRRRLRALLKTAGAGARSQLARFELSFVHESAARERRTESNERLEFLGDAVLGFVCASWLHEQFPQFDEGWLTQRKAALVNDRVLAATAQRLGFSDLLELGEGMRRAGGAENVTILADAFEAFLGALYLECGEQVARAFLLREHVPAIDLSPESVTDAKTRLQHLLQERYRQAPRYRDRDIGTPQEPRFRSQVILKDRVVGSGTGKSKKTAQIEAATKALESLIPARAPAKRKT